MADGIKILPYVVLAVLKYFESKLLRMDSLKILEFFSNIKNYEIDKKIMLRGLMNVKKNVKSKTLGKIYPLSQPKLCNRNKYRRTSIGETGILMKNTKCPITDSFSEMSVLKTQEIQRKPSPVFSYGSSFNIDGNDDCSPITDNKSNENYDMNDILYEFTV